MEAADGFVEEREVEEELHQLADGHLACEDLRAAEPEDEADAERGGEGHRGRVDGPRAHHGERALAEVFGAGTEAGVLVALATEGFDLADALKVVHEQGVHGAGGLALDSVALVGGERIPERAADEDGQWRERYAGEQRICPEKDCQHTNNT